ASLSGRSGTGAASGPDRRARARSGRSRSIRSRTCSSGSRRSVVHPAIETSIIALMSDIDPTIRRRLLAMIDGAERLDAEQRNLRARADRLRDEIAELQRQLGRYSELDISRHKAARENRDRIEREIAALRDELMRLNPPLAAAIRRAHAAVEPVRRLVLHIAPPPGLLTRPDWRPDLQELRLMVVRA